MYRSSYMGSVNERTSGFKRVTSRHQWGPGYWHSERLHMREEFSRGFPMASMPSTYQKALPSTSGSFVFLPSVSCSGFICETKRKVGRGNLLLQQPSVLPAWDESRWDTENYLSCPCPSSLSFTFLPLWLVLFQGSRIEGYVFCLPTNPALLSLAHSTILLLFTLTKSK